MPVKRSNIRPLYANLIMALIGIAVATAAVAPFFFSRREKVPGTNQILRLIDTHDLWMHLYIMQEFDSVLRSGVIYPRWIPEINRGYGILNMIYYPPGFFYMTSSVHTVISDWHYVVFAVAALALAGSGFTLYLLARMFYSRTASFIAALFYMLIPFHMLDLYYRGALPQFVGYLFLPLIFYFVYRLGREGGARYFAGLGLSFGLFLLTHLPVGLMLSYAIGFLGLVWSVREKDWRIGLRLASGLAIGLMLSAIYWLPAAVETKLAYENASDWYPYHHYKSYISLLAVEEGTAYWTFWKLLNEVFIAHALAVFIPIIILLFLPKRPSEDFGLAKLPEPSAKPLSAYWAPNRMWIVMGAATIFMCTSFSIYVSKLLPKIQVAVPAWRWLVISSVFASLLLAACVDRLRKSSDLPALKLWGLRAALCAMILFNLWITLHGTILGALGNYTYRPKADTTFNLIEPNWTPKDASRPQDLPDTANVVLEPEGGVIQILEWKPQHRKVSVKLDQPARLRLRTYNFPGWTAYIDGSRVPMLSDKDGAQVIEVPAGIHSIEAVFRNSPPRTIGMISFNIGLLAIIGLTAVDQLKRRRREREKEKARSEAKARDDESQEEALEPEALPASVSGAAQPRAFAPRLPVKAIKLGALVVVAAVAVAIILLVVKPFGSEDRSVQDKPASSRSESRSVLSIGSEAMLHVEGLDSVPVAVDERALEELIQGISGKDETKVENLVRSGKSFKVEDKTKVRILEIGTAKIKVRISEGKDIMKEAWVPERWIR